CIIACVMFQHRTLASRTTLSASLFSVPSRSPRTVSCAIRTMPSPVASPTFAILTTLSSIFFFQAEDGIRDPLVTGVQTCALPIYPRVVAHVNRTERLGHHHRVGARECLRDPIDCVRLVVPFRVSAHRLALALRGVYPVDARAALGLVHRPRGANDENRHEVDVGGVGIGNAYV